MTSMPPHPIVSLCPKLSIPPLAAPPCVHRRIHARRVLVPHCRPDCRCPPTRAPHSITAYTVQPTAVQAISITSLLVGAAARSAPSILVHRYIQHSPSTPDTIDFNFRFFNCSCSARLERLLPWPCQTFVRYPCLPTSSSTAGSTGSS
jgi:hypothetical protein